MSRLSDFFGKLASFFISAFADILKTIFDQVLRGVLANMWSIVVQEIARLERFPDLLDEEKRKKAFDAIKQRLKDEGLEGRDAVVNLSIELAVQYMKRLRRVN